MHLHELQDELALLGDLLLDARELALEALEVRGRRRSALGRLRRGREAHDQNRRDERKGPARHGFLPHDQ